LLSLKQRGPRIDFRSRRYHLLTPLLALSLLFVAVGPMGSSASASGSGTIQGTVFQDLNRNGVQDTGEAPLASQELSLFDGNGQYLAHAYSDTGGNYRFTGLADGAYRVEFGSPSWWALWENWVPTTTGSIYPRRTVSLAGSATVDFGWRAIVRSTDLLSPISTYVGGNGLRVQSFDDVVPAREIYDAIMRGTVGAEAPYVTVRFDYGTSASTTAGWQGAPGSYSNYGAVCYDNYVSWLNQGDVVVSHEYGHAWTRYYDTVVQQEGELRSYLRARGLEGDSRVNSSYAWSASELAAEDYRQLLGSPTARSAPQTNRELPPASEVPGLLEFFRDTFTTPPAAPPPPPTTTPPLTVAAPSVNPTPVTKSGTVSTSISAGAKVTVEIRNASGALVRTLLSSATEPAGSLSVKWDRKDALGRRVKSGTYTAAVSATGDGGSASASSAFRVS